MTNIETILVGLDFTDSDATVLRHVKALNTLLSPKKIIFVNVHTETALPEEIAKQFPDLVNVIDRFYIEEIVNEVTPLNLFNAVTECKALEGDPIEKIIEETKSQHVDLIVLGKKNDYNHVHLAHRKLVRKSPCNVLVIPDNSVAKYEKIIVSTDFSDYSELAVQHSEYLASRSKGELICEHIYEVPTGYYKTGKSYTEFAKIMRTNAESQYRRFVEKRSQNGKMTPHFTLNDRNDIGETIVQVSKDRKANLIVVGAKGKGKVHATLMGSVSESLLEHDHTIPLLIVKEKEHVFSFWKDFYGLS